MSRRQPTPWYSAAFVTCPWASRGIVGWASSALGVQRASSVPWLLWASSALGAQRVFSVPWLLWASSLRILVAVAVAVVVAAAIVFVMVVVVVVVVVVAVVAVSAEAPLRSDPLDKNPETRGFGPRRLLFSRGETARDKGKPRHVSAPGGVLPCEFLLRET